MNRRAAVGVGIAAAVLAAAGVMAGVGLRPEAPRQQAASREESKERGANWTTGAKQGIGTATTETSKVWYTLAQGVTTDVFYPTLDHSNVQDLQFVIVDKAHRAELERDATSHRVEQAEPEALIYRQINEKPSRYRITKTFVTDPARSTVLMDVVFTSLDTAPYQLYVLYNPSLGNSALHDRGRTDTVDRGLSATEGTFHSYLKAAHGATFAKMSNGYSANNDGWTDLKDNGRMDVTMDQADEGNLVQTAQLSPATSAPSFGFQLALGFGDTPGNAKATANATLATPGGFATVRNAYVKSWQQYLSTLKPAPKSVASNPRLTQVYRTSVMALHAGEDKNNRGAQVAALATPWGDQKLKNANNDEIRDYHAVWSRDAYQQATALLAAGDQAQANRILDFLLTKQQIREGAEAGEFPRFSKVDGTALPGERQLDEAAFPVILAWQLRRTDTETWSHVERIANRIATAGPATGTERWEEQGGLSPSTIAAEIAALICAADLARAQTPPQEETAKRWEQRADGWRRQLPFWTFVDSGPLGDGKYYERIELRDQPDPNDDDVRNWAGGHRPAKEKEVVDSGFLELVRLGVESADDPKIVGSLAELDSRTEAVALRDKGRFYYRYNKGLDGYGEDSSGKGWSLDGVAQAGTGLGRPWPVLSGERGEYELAAGRAATDYLSAMAAAANEGNLIPEQVWDTTDIPAAGLKRGQPTGSATPLGWAAGQFVRLAQSIDAGRPVETPSIVAARYVHPVVDVTFSVTVPGTGGRDVFLAGELSQFQPGAADWAANGLRMKRLDASRYQVTVKTREGGRLFHYKYTLGDWKAGEKAAGTAPCPDVPNRELTVDFGAGGQHAVNDRVAAWASVAPC